MNNIYSKFAYRLGTEEIPLHKRITVRLKPRDEFKDDTLLYVASVNEKGKLSFLGKNFVDGFIEAKTNVLGTYLIAKDKNKPTVKPVNFKDKGSVTENWSLRVEIDDEETGILKYAMYINNVWVLADYDAKNKLLVYQIDHHLKSGKNNLKVVVTDMVGNESVYTAVIQR